MMIKTVNEFKLMRVDLPLDKKVVENEDWATGPSGSRGPQSGARGPAFRNTSNISNIRSFVIHLQITSTKL